VKYLCPGRDHSSLLQDAAQIFSTAQPIVDDAAKLAAATGVPGVGLIAGSTAALLDTVGRLKLTSVPPEGDYKWCVQRVVKHTQGEGLFHGVKWTLPKKLFVEFGARLTGSIAVSIVPSIPAKSDYFQPQRLPIKATAVIHPQRSPKEFIHLPEVDLEIEPRELEIDTY
jgi:hypothetical protein